MARSVEPLLEPHLEPHIVKRRDRFIGTIVQVRGKYACIVDLGNGCAGTLRMRADDPRESIDGRLYQVGQQIEVEVVRIWGCLYAGPRSVALACAADVDARWSRAEAACPVGALVTGSVVKRVEGGTSVALPEGVSGWLPDRELKWSRDTLEQLPMLAPGVQLCLKVTGHAPGRHQILLSLRQTQEHPLDRVDAAALIGTNHRGVVARAFDYGLFVRLPIGVDGLLHRSKLPARPWPAAGEPIDVRVESIDRQLRRVALSRSLG